MTPGHVCVVISLKRHHGFLTSLQCTPECVQLMFPPHWHGGSMINPRHTYCSVNKADSQASQHTAPLGAGGIMFSGCPYVRLYVRLSGEVSGHLPENAWREWSEILHVDVSWAPSELIRLWSWSVDFPPFGVTLT